jgi:transcriptional regulator with XRE-family HTH domain
MVRRVREARGWSQEMLAVQLKAHVGINLGQSGIVRIEKGERPTRLNQVVAIARFLDLDLAALYVPLEEQLLTEEDIVKATNELADIKKKMVGIREAVRQLEDLKSALMTRGMVLGHALREAKARSDG